MATINEVIIEPKKNWQFIDWRELYEFKDLFYLLVARDIKVMYKQTVLGFGWAIVNPFFNMIVFSVIFGRLAKIPSDGIPYPIFSFAALLPWTYFSTSLSKSTQSLLANLNMITKVYFPRIYIPFVPVIGGLIDFAIAFVILIGMMFWYQIVPSLNVVFLPLLILLLMMTASGIGMWLSSLTVQYRDVRFALLFIIQILMYAAPVVWPVSLVPEKYRLLYGLYPMAGIIEGFRSALLGKTPMPWDLIGMGTLVSVVILVSGAIYFRQMERFFADIA